MPHEFWKLANDISGLRSVVSTSMEVISGERAMSVFIFSQKSIRYLESEMENQSFWIRFADQYCTIHVHVFPAIGSVNLVDINRFLIILECANSLWVMCRLPYSNIVE